MFDRNIFFSLNTFSPSFRTNSASACIIQYNNKLDDNVINVFGAKFLSTMSPVAIRLDERDNEADAGEDAGEDATEKTADVSKQSSEQDSSKRRVWGMVSKAGAGVGRADNDRQFFYLNGRPVDLPKVCMSFHRWQGRSSCFVNRPADRLIDVDENQLRSSRRKLVNAKLTASCCSC